MVCPTSKASLSFQDCQECRRTDGTTFWFTPLVSDAAAKHLMETLPNPRFDDPDPQATLLKKARQRLVTKIKADGLDGTSAVIKIFPLRNPISRLKHRKYAYTEFINYSKAQARGIPTPKVYAFWENRKFGLVNGSGVLIEFLEGYKNILEMSQETNIDYQQAALVAIPAICAMYETGAFNADGRDENIYIANNGASPNSLASSIGNMPVSACHAPIGCWNTLWPISSARRLNKIRMGCAMYGLKKSDRPQITQHPLTSFSPALTGCSNVPPPPTNALP